MSFGPPTGKYVKTKRPVLRSQLDDDAEDVWFPLAREPSRAARAPCERTGASVASPR